MKKRITVAVLMGGKSAEHEISLISGREVVKNLNFKKYNVLPIVISRNGITWQIGERAAFLLDSPAKRRGKGKKPKVGKLIKTDHVSIIKNHKVDVVFIAMHGPNGEDGTIQGFLELIGVPYTGSGILASALGMDKISSRKLFTQAGLKVPEYLVLQKDDSPQIVWKKFKPPVFVKPHNQGSSVGTTLVKEKNKLRDALNLAFDFSHLALAEEFLDGIEITCPILGNNKPKALPVVEIVPKRDFFDYKAKYNDKLCDEIVPARISKALTKKAQQIALTAYQSLGCSGFGRVDMIAKGNNIYVLEVNTIPGLTPVSLFPKSAVAAGISYPELLDKIVMFALSK